MLKTWLQLAQKTVRVGIVVMPSFDSVRSPPCGRSRSTRWRARSSPHRAVPTGLADAFREALGVEQKPSRTPSRSAPLYRKSDRQAGPTLRNSVHGEGRLHRGAAGGWPIGTKP